MTAIISIVLAGVFVIFLILGVPITIAIGFASFCTMIFYLPPDVSLQVSVQSMGKVLDSFSILAIPFFIMSGAIMNTGGLAIRLVNLAKLFTYGIPGPLMHINILSNMLFGSLSGSALAAEVAIGKVLIPIQNKEGYDPAQAAAINITSAPSGLLIPPSNTLIIYSLAAGGTSVSALFMAGYIPGILMGLGVMSVAYFYGLKGNYPKQPKIPLKDVIRIIWDAIPSLLMIIIVMGGIVKGAFTATEGAVVATLYSLILSFIYRSLNLEKMKEILTDTCFLSGIALFLMAVSSMMSWVLSFSKLPVIISESVLSLSINPTIVLLTINIILLIVGLFMDNAAAILIFTPILLPIVTKLGVDPIHFGIIMNFNTSIGLCTPPVGNGIFLGCSLANVKIEEVIKWLYPIFIVLIIILMAITYIPEISLFLPRFFNLI